MLPSEEEIADIISDRCDYNYGPDTVEDAAYTIFEKMQEGVAWKGKAYVDAFGRIRFLTPESKTSYVNGKEVITDEMFYPGLAGGEGSVVGLAGKAVYVIVEEVEGAE